MEGIDHFEASATKVEVRAASALVKAAPGDRFPIAVELDIAPEWHVWTSEVQSRALPKGMTNFDGAIYTSIAVAVNPAAAATAGIADIQWPAPHAVEGDLGEGKQTFGVYEGKAVAFIPVILSPSATGTVEFTVTVELQACSTVCLAPGSIEAKVSVEVTPGAKQTAGAAETPLFVGFDPTVFGKMKETATMGEAAPRVASALPRTSSTKASSSAALIAWGETAFWGTPPGERAAAVAMACERPGS